MHMGDVTRVMEEHPLDAGNLALLRLSANARLR